ncbi:MAG: hypothetical protein JXR05_04955 [Flavobacteriaceae bacterium]
MFTDFYFTNLSSTRDLNSIVFSQKTMAQESSMTSFFFSIENCQYKWSHKIRVYWNLGFRFIERSGNISPLYNLKTSFTKQKKAFIISKSGITSIQQGYSNGKESVDFEKLKGDGFIAVQLYRGDYLIGEQYFKGSHLNFQVDSIISISQYNHKNKTLFEDIRRTILNVDFICFRSVFIKLLGDKNTGTSLKIESAKKWFEK